MKVPLCHGCGLERLWISPHLDVCKFLLELQARSFNDGSTESDLGCIRLLHLEVHMIGHVRSKRAAEPCMGANLLP